MYIVLLISIYHEFLPNVTLYPYRTHAQMKRITTYVCKNVNLLYVYTVEHVDQDT